MNDQEKVSQVDETRHSLAIKSAETCPLSVPNLNSDLLDTIYPVH